jgi:hypothetical protein
MKITKGKNHEFTISGLSLGKLIAIANAFEIVKEERIGAYTLLKEEVHTAVLMAIKEENKFGS